MSGRRARPDPDTMRLAAEWLVCYEGAEDTLDLAACADWLRQTADDDEVRAMALKAGVPVAKLRARLAERSR